MTGPTRDMTREMWVEQGLIAVAAVVIIVVLVGLICLYKRRAEKRFDR